MQYYHHVTDEETKTQRSYTLALGYSQYSVGSWDPNKRLCNSEQLFFEKGKCNWTMRTHSFTHTQQALTRQQHLSTRHGNSCFYVKLVLINIL